MPEDDIFADYETEVQASRTYDNVAKFGRGQVKACLERLMVKLRNELLSFHVCVCV